MVGPDGAAGQPLRGGCRGAGGTGPPSERTTIRSAWWYQSVTRGRSRAMKREMACVSGSDPAAGPGVVGVEGAAVGPPAVREVAVQVHPARVVARARGGAVGVHGVDQPQRGAPRRPRPAKPGHHLAAGVLVAVDRSHHEHLHARPRASHAHRADGPALRRPAHQHAAGLGRRGGGGGRRGQGGLGPGRRRASAAGLHRPEARGEGRQQQKRGRAKHAPSMPCCEERSRSGRRAPQHVDSRR